jgi:hypothetical protein
VQSELVGELLAALDQGLGRSWACDKRSVPRNHMDSLAARVLALSGHLAFDDFLPIEHGDVRKFTSRGSRLVRLEVGRLLL